jgi:hypothetical protein
MMGIMIELLLLIKPKGLGEVMLEKLCREEIFGRCRGRLDQVCKGIDNTTLDKLPTVGSNAIFVLVLGYIVFYTIVVPKSCKIFQQRKSSPRAFNFLKHKSTSQNSGNEESRVE